MVACGSVACSSSSSPPTATTDSGAAIDSAGSSETSSEGGGGPVTEHGQLVDYFKLKGAEGLTVTDHGVSATTDANGMWSLTLPAGTALLQPSVTGPKYSNLLLPDVKPTGSDVDHGAVVIPDSQAITLEEASLAGFDTTKALVQVVATATGSCASAVGGSIKVLSPSGTSLIYFAPTGFPDPKLTSFQAVTAPRNVAAIYNVTPGATVTVQVDHPTCKWAPYPAAAGSVTFLGTTRTVAIEPGGVNSALVVVYQ